MYWYVFHCVALFFWLYVGEEFDCFCWCVCMSMGKDFHVVECIVLMLYIVFEKVWVRSLIVLVGVCVCPWAMISLMFYMCFNGLLCVLNVCG